MLECLLCHSSWSLIVAHTFLSVLLPSSFLPHRSTIKRHCSPSVISMPFLPQPRKMALWLLRLGKLGHPTQIAHLFPTDAIVITVSKLTQNHLKFLPIIFKFSLAYILCFFFLARATSMIHPFTVHLLGVYNFSQFLSLMYL